MDVVYYAAASLDGFIATAGGGVEWLDRVDRPGEDYGYGEFYAAVDALLMGSATYEFALGHPPWPYAGKPSWVFTRRGLPVAGPEVTLTAEDPEQVVATLAGRGVARTWLVGGGRLATSFRERGLITHLTVAVIPVLLGAGIPLFADPSEADAPRMDGLRLLESKPHASGLVLLDYAFEKD